MLVFLLVDSQTVVMHTIHIVAGSPGSGKTTFGKQLAKKISGIFLDIDTCTEKIVAASMVLAGLDPNDRDSPTFKNTFRCPIYDSLFAIAADNIENLDVVIVGPFTKEVRDSGWLSTLREKFQAPVVVYFIYCSPEIRYQRLISRRNPRDASKLIDWRAHCGYYTSSSDSSSDMETIPAFEHVFVNTSL